MIVSLTRNMDTTYQGVYDGNSSGHLFPIHLAQKLAWTLIPLDGYYPIHTKGQFRYQVKLNCAPWNDLASGFITLQMQLNTLLNRCPVLWENEEEKPVIDSSSGWSDVTTFTMGKLFNRFPKEPVLKYLMHTFLLMLRPYAWFPVFAQSISIITPAARLWQRKALVWQLKAWEAW